MPTSSKRTKSRDSTLSALDTAIEDLTLVNEVSTIAPAKAAFGSVGIVLTMIKVRFPTVMLTDELPMHFQQDFMIDNGDYVSLGLNCAEICQALDRGTNGKSLNDLNQSVHEAINQLTT